MAKCGVCGTTRELSEFLKFTGKTTGGFVCRPDRWFGDSEAPGHFRQFSSAGKKRKAPCFRDINKQAISLAVPQTYKRFSDEYPIRPGTDAWVRLVPKGVVTEDAEG